MILSASRGERCVMFAYLKFAVAAVFLGFLAGCATTGGEVKQPDVTPDVQRALAGRTLKEMPIYVKPGVVYYELSNFELRKVPTSSLVASDVENGKSFKNRFVKQLREDGFRLADLPCAECLEMEVGFLSSSGIYTIGYGATLDVAYDNVYVLRVERGATRNRTIWGGKMDYVESDSEWLSRNAADGLLQEWGKKFGKIPAAAAADR